MAQANIITESALDTVAARERVMDTAKAAILRDRNASYGNPEDNFRDIAALWEVYKGYPFTALDVGVMMALVKVSRIKTSPLQEDHYVDLAGYAGCAGAIAASERFAAQQREQEEQTPDD